MSKVRIVRFERKAVCLGRPVHVISEFSEPGGLVALTVLNES